MDCINGHRNPERYANGTCKQCTKDKAEAWRRDPVNWEKRRETERLRAQRQRQADREAALVKYGPDCQCCGESIETFLTIDHIDGDGADHRKEIFGSNYKNRPPAGHRTYRWLRLNGYPSGFQVLCFNCNYAKHALGACPHQKGK